MKVLISILFVILNICLLNFINLYLESFGIDAVNAWISSGIFLFIYGIVFIAFIVETQKE